MTIEFRKVATVALIAVFLILAVRPNSLAMDSNGKFFAYGVGQMSCEDYVKLREKGIETLEKQERYTKDELYEMVDKVIEYWIAGFLTAHNFYVTDTYDLAGNVKMEELKPRLEKICRANTKQYFAEAMIKLTQELHPQRIKAAVAK
jgi:hypothetical protein